MANGQHLFKNFSIKDKYGAMAATATLPIVIFAGVYLAWRYASRVYASRAFKSRANFKNNQRPVLSKSTSIGMLHGGKLALKRLHDYHTARADAMVLNEAALRLTELIGDPYRPDHFWNLKCTTAKLEMAGKEDVAVTILETAVRDARNDKKPHETYEIEMSLVEMLIYKGEFKKADSCECLSVEAISDARRPLYKAILRILLGHPEAHALNCWEDFRYLQEYFLLQPSLAEEESIHKIVNTSFEEFKKIVNLLKDDIEKDAREKQYRNK